MKKVKIDKSQSSILDFGVDEREGRRDLKLYIPI